LEESHRSGFGWLFFVIFSIQQWKARSIELFIDPTGRVQVSDIVVILLVYCLSELFLDICFYNLQLRFIYLTSMFLTLL